MNEERVEEIYQSWGAREMAERIVELEEHPVTLAAVCKPGDTLVIGFGRPIDDEEVEWMEESFRDLIDRGIKVAFADQVTSMVVARPGGDEGGE